MWHAFITWYQYRLKLNELRKQADAVADSYQTELDAAEKARDWNNRNAILSAMYSEQSISLDEIEEMRTNRIIGTARSLAVAVPSRLQSPTAWEQSDVLGCWYLTEAAYIDLLSAIRVEKRERREPFMAWATVLISILSLVVAILALLKT